jgi:hypothetical protein
MSQYKSYQYYDFVDKKNLFKKKAPAVRVFAFRWLGYKKHNKKETVQYRIKRFCFKKQKISKELCKDCSKPLLDHGLICISHFSGEKLWSKLCPGNWILVHRRETWPCPHTLFKRIYEPSTIHSSSSQSEDKPSLGLRMKSSTALIFVLLPRKPWNSLNQRILLYRWKH